MKYSGWLLLFSSLISLHLIAFSADEPPVSVIAFPETLPACDRQADSLTLAAMYIYLIGLDSTWNTHWDLSDPMDTWFGVTLTAEGCVEKLELPNNGIGHAMPINILNLEFLKVLDLSGNNFTGCVQGDSAFWCGQLTFADISGNPYLLFDSIAEICNPIWEINCPPLPAFTFTGPDLDTLQKYPKILTDYLTPAYHAKSCIGKLSVLDQLIGVDCNPDTLLRRYTLSDQGDSVSSCMHQIVIKQPDLQKVLSPADIIFSCDQTYTIDQNNLPHPDSSGYPFFSTRYRSDLTLNTDEYGLTAGYEDFSVTLVGEEVQFVRQWTVTDECAPESPRTLFQNISFCANCRFRDSLALVEIYENHGGSSWTYTPTEYLSGPSNLSPIPNAGQSWDFGQPIDTWHGVSLNADGCIEMLCLNEIGLSGGIPDVELSKLKEFYCYGNGLNNTIPDFTGFPSLEVLDCRDNNLSGPLPNFSNLAQLLVLHVAGNQIDGQIPDFTDLPNLELFFCFDNQLTGSIPDFTALNALRLIDFRNNQISGNIPDFANTPALESIQAYNNLLSGAIPDFTNLPALRSVNLALNRLSGLIPDFSDNCPQLRRLYIDRNSYTFEHITPSITANTSLIESNVLATSDSLRYAPQDSIFTDSLITGIVNQPLTINLLVDESEGDNEYQWYKDGMPFTTISGINELTFNSIQLSDAGTYWVHVVNPEAPQLTLESHLIEIVVNEDQCASLPKIDLIGDTICQNDTAYISVTNFPQSEFIEHFISDDINSSWVEVAFIDNDSLIDIVSISGEEGNIIWYQNNQDQIFSRYVISSNARPSSSVHAADIDNDGFQDLVLTSDTISRVLWYENDGAGNFSEHVIDSFINGADELYPIDFNLDGAIDLLYSSLYYRKIGWYENLGEGNFVERGVYEEVSGVLSIFPVDLNGDEHMDVISASWSNDEVAWYENLGDMTFSRHIISTNYDYPTSIIGTDLDQDGNNDIALASRFDGRVTWFQNDGNGSFMEQMISSNLSQPVFIHASDLNNDNSKDLLCGDIGADKIIWFQNNGQGQFEEFQVYTKPDWFPNSLSTADINMDGLTDILSTGGYNKEIAWYEQTQEIKFPVSISFQILGLQEQKMDGLSLEYGSILVPVFDLPAGLNQVTIKEIIDAEGCIYEIDQTVNILVSSLELELPTKIEICAGDMMVLDPGAIGTNYLWSTGDTTQSIVLESAGSYSVSIEDTFGCIAIDTSELIYSLPVEIDVTPLSSPSAPGVNDGKIEIIYDGDSPPFLITWEGPITGSTLVSEPDTFVLEGLSAGRYLITVEDANGCTASDQVYLFSPGEELVLFNEEISFATGESTCIPIQTTGFTNVFGFQFTLSYDPELLTYDQILNPSLPGMSPGGNFGKPSSGIITAYWFDQQVSGVTVPDSTTLFEVCFTAQSCGTSNLQLTRIPTEIEASVEIDSYGVIKAPIKAEMKDIIIPAFTASVDTQQPDCTSTTGSATVTSTGQNLTYAWSTGANGTATLSDLSSGDYSVTVSDVDCEVVLPFSIGSNGDAILPPECINGLPVELLPQSPDDYRVTVYASDFIAASPPNCTDPVAYSINRTGEAADQNMDSLILNCADIGTVEVDLYAWDASGNSAACQTTILVQDNSVNCTSDTLQLRTDPVLATVGNPICLPIIVDNFVDITGGQFTLIYDSTKLEFVEISNINIRDMDPDINFGLFKPGVLGFLWFDQEVTGVTLVDGTIAFEVCFSAIGCGETSIMLSDSPTAIEFSKIGHTNGIPYKIAFSGLEIASDFSVSVETNNTTCDLENGTATVSIAGPPNDYTYVWSDGQGSGNMVTNLGIGEHSVTVSTGACSIVEMFTISSDGGNNIPEFQGNNPTQYTYCEGDDIPTISLSTTPGATIDWYTTSSGGLPLLSSSPSFTPDSPGVYYAEARHLEEGCLSNNRLRVELTEVPLLVTEISETTCSIAEVGIDTFWFNSVAGCDSMVILSTFLVPIQSTEISEMTCRWSEVGRQVDILTSAAGCDSLVIYERAFNEDLIVQLPPAADCQSGQLGLDTTFYTTALGCDSLVIREWLPGQPVEVMLDTLLCSGESLLVNNNVYNADRPSGTEVLQTASGCDSTIFISLQFTTAQETVLNDNLCFGESLTVNGTIYDAGNPSGTELLATATGCDSLIRIDLTFTPEIATSFSIERCTGSSYSWNEQTYTTTGIYTQTLVSAANCDSVVTLDLTIFTAPEFPGSTPTNYTFCSGESPPQLSIPVGPELTVDWYDRAVGGTSLLTGNPVFTPSAAGIFYAEARHIEQGCLSVDRLKIEVKEQTNVLTQVNLITCLPEEAGTDTLRLMAAGGCDSTVILSTVYEPVVPTEVSESTCIWSEAGMKIDTLLTAAGCDSILVFNRSFPDQLITYLPDTISCFPDLIGLDTLFLQTVDGCDSLVIREWLSGEPVKQTVDSTICAGEDVLFAGQLLTESGTYFDTLSTESGCDSLITLFLQVEDNGPFTAEIQLCPGETYNFGNRILSEPGEYTHRFIRSSGCDSIVLLTIEQIGPEDLTAVDDFYSLEGNETELRVDVTTNDSFPTVDWFTILLDDPEHGTAELSLEGQLIYRLNNLDFLGVDSFTYHLCLDICRDTCVEAVVKVSRLRDCLPEIISELPNGFTPDGDGLNDQFDPIGSVRDRGCQQNPENAQLTILNRWGEIIYAPKRYAPWDGTFADGRQVPAGVYYFILRFELDETIVLREVLHVF